MYGVRGFSLKPLRFRNLGLTNYQVVIEKKFSKFSRSRVCVSIETELYEFETILLEEIN